MGTTDHPASRWRLTDADTLVVLNDPLLNAVARTAFYETIRWVNEGGSEDELQTILFKCFVDYQRALRESNTYLKSEVIRLRTLVTEPMRVGAVPSPPVE